MKLRFIWITFLLSEFTISYLYEKIRSLKTTAKHVRFSGVTDSVTNRIIRLEKFEYQLVTIEVLLPAGSLVTRGERAHRFSFFIGPQVIILVYAVMISGHNFLSVAICGKDDPWEFAQRQPFA